MDNELRRLVDEEKKNEVAEQLPQAKTAFSVVEEQTQTLLNTPEVKKICGNNGRARHQGRPCKESRWYTSKKH